MVVTKSDSLARKLPKRGRIVFADKIRPHSVPNDDNYAARLICGLRSAHKSTKPAHTGDFY